MNNFPFNSNQGKPYKFPYSPTQPYGPNLLEIIKRQYENSNSTSSKEGFFANELKPDISDIEIKLSSNSDLLSLFRKKMNNSLNFDEGLSPINRDLDFTSHNFIVNDDSSNEINSGDFDILDPLEKRETSSSGNKSEKNVMSEYQFQFNGENSLKNKREKSLRRVMSNTEGGHLNVPNLQKNPSIAQITQPVITRNTNLIMIVRKKQENLLKEFSPIHEETSNFNFTFDHNTKTQNLPSMKLDSNNHIPELPSSESQNKTPRNNAVVETSMINKSCNDEGNKVVNQYILESELGRGAFGKVKLAKSQTDNQYYVLTSN